MLTTNNPYKRLFFFGVLLLISCGEPAPEKKENKQALAVDSTRVEETATPGAETEGEYYFSGLINHKYAINLRIQINQTQVEGSYYYNSQRRELNLKGTVDGPNLEMDELVKEKITGHFTGTTYGTDSISGTWKSPKGKEMDFVLYHSDKEKYDQYLQEKAPKRFDLALLKKFRAKFKTVSLPFEYEAMNEEWGDDHLFTEEEIKTYAMEDYDPETYFGYRLYHGVTFETNNYIALVFTEDYYPGAFGIHNQSLVLITVGKNGELIDEAYLGCHCMDTNMGSNDYYATDDKFTFTLGNIKVDSESIHATLIEEENPEEKPFEERTSSVRNISIDAHGKIGNTGY